MPNERKVSMALVWVWMLWTVGLVICVAGTTIVLVWGEELWARAVGLSLFGAEMLVVAAAAVVTARLLLKRQVRRIDKRLQDEPRRLSRHG